MNKIEQMNKIKESIEKYLICNLKNNAKNLVFGRGNLDAKILFIGEAPGAKEDESGEPFVGAAGKNLDKILEKNNIDKYYIANILKYRPPNNRNPTNEEIKNHTPYLIEQIKIIKPKIIVTLGNYSSKFILSKCDVNNMKKIEGITNIRGKIYEIELDNIKFYVMPIYHPAAIIYNRKLKEEFEEDFTKLANIVNENNFKIFLSHLEDLYPK